MDNFDELDEPVIASGHKRKLKAEKFSWNFAKAARYMVREKLSVLLVTHPYNL